VEILTEDLNTNDKIKENKYECKNLISEENNKKNNDKSSINVEADSENFFEIENDINNGIDDESSSEEIIFNNNYNNVNLQIGEDYWNIYNKNTNNINQNESLSNKNNIIKSQKEIINPILKQKKKYLVNKNNRYYNKTLSYSKSPKNILFVIPEIAENPNKGVVVPHPSCKLNNKYVNEFNFAECGCNDILLVDDDEFICKTFKNILKKFKLQADTAENGQECLKMIKEKIEKNCKCEKSKYKIIFMDITMPVMDGIEAAKNIQKMIDKKEIYDSLKIIFVSAHANLDLSSTISGIKCAVDYYAKPISADMYKNVLNKYYYEKS
jgi:CheY-like chemotaxis protein